MTLCTRGRRGVALPMALFVVVVLTILLAAGFAALSSERRVHANDEAALDAFTLAETGLELFIAKRDSLPRVLGGLGIAIISTSKGLVTDKQAQKDRTGGEVLCFVW